uniref:Large ribosomal subunit protein uL22c n=1 Tax=Rivina humilis TaxID=3533 RepID=A0A411JXI3_RIVHU|nr:ribosomal protein L22 [Rivina humilis]QBC69808.1 ribosomal protein L22 [Rivina humilis]
MRKKPKKIDNIEGRLIRKQIKLRRRDDVYVFGQYISMSADKARRVIDQIRGHSYEHTLMILELMPYRACYPIFKLIYSAAANASHNKGFNKANLIILKAEVNKGAAMKRLKPQARGRSYLIKKTTCHINIVLRDMSYFEDFRQLMKNVSEYDQDRVINELRGEQIDLDMVETLWAKK